VLLVGNHSSGKSSFVNYVLGRDVQTAGVAPTDDCFTVIAPGPADRDQDGPALVGDPDLGFSQLRQFGPTLMHHTRLKIRSGIDSDFIMVDSPGMIDSPAQYSGMMLPVMDAAAAGGGRYDDGKQQMDRGYDFTGVVRWLADRADIVWYVCCAFIDFCALLFLFDLSWYRGRINYHLIHHGRAAHSFIAASSLFFDPDKPGTTGETLSILLHALSGMDHKLLIVLNKADQFGKIHDFARAYGSLCWNLSKVIPRKDLPRIYTMCLPVAENKAEAVASQQQQQQEPPPLSGLVDLLTARDEVVAEVR